MAGRYPPLIGEVSRWAERLTRQLEGDHEIWGGIRWETFCLPGSTINTAGAAANDPDRDSDTHDLLFDASSTEEIPISIMLPNGYKVGTGIVPLVLYEPTDGTAGTVIWQLSVGHRDIGDTFDYSTSFVATTLTQTLSAGAERLHRTLFPSLSASITAVHSMIEMRLARLGGSDTYAADIRVKQIGFTCQTDRRGSRTETLKD